MDLPFSPWLIWFLAGIAVMLAELAVPGFVILCCFHGRSAGWLIMFSLKKFIPSGT